MKLTYLCPMLALAGGLAVASSAVRAQTLLVAFSPPVQTAAPGGSADFTGLFTNTTGSDYFITGGTFSGSSLLTGFFNGDTVNGDSTTGAFEVLNGKTATILAVYTLSADLSTPAGPYSGTVDFSGETAADYAKFQSGGPDNSAVLASTPVTLSVTPAASAAPEPSQLAGLGFTALGLGGLLLWARRRRATPMP